jgi:hypothetical protein
MEHEVIASKLEADRALASASGRPGARDARARLPGIDPRRLERWPTPVRREEMLGAPRSDILERARD